MHATEFCSEEIEELARAMVAVQKALQPAVKDRDNTFTKSRYATLNSVMEACRGVLLEQGIWVVQHLVPADPGNLGLVTKLVHTESGQWQASLMIMPLPKSDPQGYGSALTYARRYALATSVGLITEDDDAEAAMARCRNEEPPRPEPDIPPVDPSVALPRLDGVQYRTVKAQDGRDCITASGETRARKAILQEAGFRWDSTRKIWWRYVDRAA